MAGNNQSLKAQVYNFIKHNKAGALATVDHDSVPHVAIVYFLARKNLDLYFTSRVEGRKFHNLIDHPLVSIAFYNDENLSTVQLTGVAKRIESLEEEQQITYELARLRRPDVNWPTPPMKLFERGATNELAIIKVSPTEMTYANFENQPNGRYKPYFTKVI